MMFPTFGLIAQTGSGWLSGGYVDLPFPWVAAIIGLVVLGLLVYWARRIATERLSE